MFYLRLQHVFTQNHCVKTTQTRVHTCNAFSVAYCNDYIT